MFVVVVVGFGKAKIIVIFVFYSYLSFILVLDECFFSKSPIFFPPTVIFKFL